MDYLTGDDFERAQHLKEEDMTLPRNQTIFKASEGNIVEGDIVSTPSKESAVKTSNQLWPNGRVPYVIDQGFSQQDKAIIARGMQSYAENTCIRFVPKQPTDRQYARIYRGNGCSSPIGRNVLSGRNDVSLGQGCVHVGVVIHELGHTIGLFHEMSRNDRDSYITINMRNVQPAQRFNYNKAGFLVAQDIDRYDYLSVMHYDQYAFSIQPGRLVTIIARDSQYQNQMGNRPGFSPQDIQKINQLYRCQSGGVKPETIGSGVGIIRRWCKLLLMC